jgi:hypothetical protein
MGSKLGEPTAKAIMVLHIASDPKVTEIEICQFTMGVTEEG